MKTTEEDEEEKQKVTASLAASKVISVDAAVTFALKQEQKNPPKKLKALARV